ncbi:MAG: Uma2 family endonuclease [Armatimonadetes bacterium]|nr:Uma2 family endonuclease [Armatimonadota bacterium]
MCCASSYSEPEPDFAIVGREAVVKARRHKIPADLVIEVAQTSLRYDRDEKGSLYARMGVREYWILNVVDRVLELHLEPVADDQARFGFSYGR